tara:strand:+ start:3216 stop:4058 length:843 start_codon:yes stop_codon:yes gene_type:complete
MIDSLGEGPFKGLYSLIALLGLILIIWGYGQARLTPELLYSPPVWLRHVSLVLLLPVFPLLFGGFLAWAVADRISLKRRQPRKTPALPGTPLNDAIAVVGGLIVYGLFVVWLHMALIGVPPIQYTSDSVKLSLTNTLRLQPLADLSRVHGAALAGDFPALLEQNQRGNTADTKLAGRPGSLFGVELGKANLTLPLLCSLLILGRHRLAGAAPAGPEVYQHGHIAAPGVCRKGLLCQLQQLIRPERLFARTTVTTGGKLVRRHAIRFVAMGAHEVSDVSHA